MTLNKDEKRVIRARMKKTGESYTAARSALSKKPNGSTRGGPTTGPSQTAPRSEWPKVAGTSNDALENKTGRTWAQWVDELDRGNAQRLKHPEIVKRILANYPKVSHWWAQTITVGYERIHGLREVGQRRDGGYEANKSRTYPVRVDTLYRAFHDARVRKKWLPGGAKRLRTATENKSLRFDWEDGTQVNVYFIDKGGEKSTVVIQHTKLAKKVDTTHAKEQWAKRLDALKKFIID